jgi:chromate transporter
LGYKRGGKIGLFLAGICFILPAMTIVLLLAMFYKQYGEVPLIEAIFTGIKPVILAVIIQALFRLGQTTIKNTKSLLLFLAAYLLSLLGVGEITILIMTGLTMLLAQQLSKWRSRHLAIEPMSLTLLFLTFLKIGSVLYGSGYVLLAFLQAEFIDRYAVLTSTQLLDAVAIGQFTPGPVFTTATFVGYLIQGVPGALLATAGIFLPSFLLILLLHPLFNKLRASKIFSSILDGITVASLALMASVSWQFGTATFVSWISVVIFAVSFIALTKFKVNSSYMIILGGFIGWLLTVF